MKRYAVAIASALGLAIASTASATTGIPWFDSFESGVGSSYQPWPGSINNQLTGDTTHAHTGTGSARQWASDPAAWNATYTMSSTTAGVTGGLETDVWVWDDNNYAQGFNGQPVNAGLALFGANGTSTPDVNTDYAELGIISGITTPGVNGNHWVIRVASYDSAHGTTWFDTGVARSTGWVHLQITADPNPSDGGDGLYHFFINGVNVDPGSTTLSRNTTVGLEWDRIGWNGKSYANFWYDDLNIQATPEPASVAVMGLGALALLKQRRRQG